MAARGDDTLNGGAGDDTLTGGPGADSFTGGTGEDTVSYATAQDEKVTVDLTRAAGAAPADPNNPSHSDGDYFPAGHGVENVIGSPRGDAITGDDEANKLWGRAGADTLNGGGGANELTGGAGNDRIVAGLGNDRVEGGAGADTLDGDAVSDAASGYAATPAGSDTLSYAGSAGAVVIDLSDQYAVAASAEQQRGHYAAGQGGDAAGDRFRGFENVTGGMGNDRLIGDGWSNTLIGGPGADRLDGGSPQATGAGPDGQFGTADDVMTGADRDTVSYAGSTAGVTITFSERRLNNEDVTIGAGSGGDAEGDRLLNIENVTGSAHDDTFIASNLSQRFNGGANAEDDPETPNVDESKDSDTVSYANLDVDLGGRFNPLVAGSGNYANIENLIGGSGNDFLDGDSNPNRLEGGAGGDSMIGDAGDDTLMGGPGDDQLIGDGRDREGFDLLNGGPGADLISGDSGETSTTRSNIQSFENFDGGRVNVDDDADATAASYGGDTTSYAGSNRGVALTLGQLTSIGADWVTDTVTGQGGWAEGDRVLDVENIIGSDHNDTLEGNNWYNVLTGGKGDDTLTGDGSAGDPNSDIFVFAPGDSTGPTGDLITDFNVSGVTRDDNSDGTPNADIYGNAIHYQRDAIDLRAFNFDLNRDSDGVITTTLAQLESQGLRISAVMDADDDEQGAGGKDDREITLPDGGKIILLDVGDAALTIDNFIFDLV